MFETTMQTNSIAPTVQSEPQTTDTGTGTGTQITPDYLRSWAGLGVDFANAFSSIWGIFSGENSQVDEYQRQMAIQSEMYNLQQKQAQKQQQTLLIAGGVVIVAVLLTVFLMKKN